MRGRVGEGLNGKWGDAVKFWLIQGDGKYTINACLLHSG